MRVLLTGGAGYIGTHLLVQLLQDGHDVVVLDDLSSGSAEALARAESVAGRPCRFVLGSIRQPDKIRQALRGVDVVFHLAALKQVSESVQRPGRYFAVNVGGMACLLDGMERQGVRRIVFSSSAAVYGLQAEMPLCETAELRPASPYGMTKQVGEQMLAQMATHCGWSAVSLRYFNPVGAHPSGVLGEPLNKAASLVPRALRALLYDDQPLTVFGSDTPPPTAPASATTCTSAMWPAPTCSRCGHSSAPATMSTTWARAGRRVCARCWRHARRWRAAGSPTEMARAERATFPWPWPVATRSRVNSASRRASTFRRWWSPPGGGRRRVPPPCPSPVWAQAFWLPVVAWRRSLGSRASHGRPDPSRAAVRPLSLQSGGHRAALADWR